MPFFNEPEAWLIFEDFYNFILADSVLLPELLDDVCEPDEVCDLQNLFSEKSYLPPKPFHFK